MSNLKPHPLNILLLIILSVTISCSYLIPTKQEIIQGRDNYYAFNSNTILQDISDGKEDLFEQSNEVTPDLENNLLQTVQWTENDFYTIAQAVHQDIWKENLAEWKLRYASFSLSCTEVIEGPQSGWFIFVRIKKYPEGNSLIEHNIYIQPSQNIVHLKETEYYPSVRNNFSEITIDSFISIRKAIEIAENAGGREIRNGLDNNCQLNIEFSNNNENWRISYVKAQREFIIDINRTTGESTILRK